MFKMIALIGAIAGGATYGLYAHTDLFNHECGKCSHCQTRNTGSDEALLPYCPSLCADCTAGCETCCVDACDLCCNVVQAAATAAQKPEACCTARVSTKKAAAAPCVELCAACGAICNACALCANDCDSCCGLSAKAAVAGPAAVVVGTKKK